MIQRGPLRLLFSFQGPKTPSPSRRTAVHLSCIQQSAPAHLRPPVLPSPAPTCLDNHPSVLDVCELASVLQTRPLVSYLTLPLSKQHLEGVRKESKTTEDIYGNWRGPERWDRAGSCHKSSENAALRARLGLQGPGFCSGWWGGPLEGEGGHSSGPGSPATSGNVASLRCWGQWSLTEWGAVMLTH